MGKVQAAANQFQNSAEDLALGSLLPPVPPRPPASVCNLQRMGAAFPTRLSFMRILLRRMSAEDWHLECGLLDLDDDGFGTAVYTAYLPERAYSLIAFANPLADEDRTDRVIASAWDAASKASASVLNVWPSTLIPPMSNTPL